MTVKVKYLVCYDTERNKAQKRAFAPSSAAVVKSLLSTLKEIGCDVEIISFSSTEGMQTVPRTRYKTEEGFTLQLFRSFGRKNAVGRGLNYLAMKAQYFLYLLFHIKKGDTVIAYHSLYHVGMLRLLKKLKSFHLVLQMLEIYADVTGERKQKEKELRLAAEADAFIFPTDTLERIVNTAGKPAAIMLGTYQVEQDRGCRFADDKIHVLYAGTLDPRKGGAVAAAKAAAHLPDNYHIHILGFGSEADKQELRKAIEESNHPNHACVTYDGLLSGEAYIQFAQSCDIGLSTQNPDADFNATSFPSKILSYMSNGLQVVSIRIPAIETSAVGKHVFFYDVQTPEKIAEAVMAVALDNGFDNRELLKKLNSDFSKKIIEVLSR